ncbi:hypothetical protein V1J52_16775 [Streptomyces sp. TRM 70351]|uniref:hypothetical protein n=1 Tax=Streptomyces sp. TRM 70351 TaxID=3116552 RepID=UPI002E7B2260|nr:hypothetical protein [Streptomyces sp. TRM 70351]MEE1929820.1 hypothetical protein [Streptomyces sp. TRM 70351]
MTWRAEFGAVHEGRPGAVLPDGSEPAPVYYDVGSGPHVPSTTDWYAYDGTLGAPLASHLRAACACGWRGEERYALDWEQVAESGPRLADVSGPQDDWEQHVADVRARTAALPAGLETLLAQVHDQVMALADEAPLAALKAVATLERTTKDAAHRAAFAVEADGFGWEEVGTALGVPARTARSRLLGYSFRT